MILPSEALNREFVLDDQAMAQSGSSVEAISVTTHAVVIGDIGLLLPSDEVSELVERLPVCKLPNTPAWFSGVTSLRGNITPVFDLHELFGVPVKSSKRRFIVIGSGETAISFWVDEMPCMVVLGGEDLMAGDPPLPDLIRNHASRFFLQNNQIWVDWNVGQFFTSLGKLL